MDGWTHIPGTLPDQAKTAWLRRQFVPLPTARQYTAGVLWRIGFSGGIVTALLASSDSLTRLEATIDPERHQFLAFLKLVIVTAVLGVVYLAVAAFVTIPLEALVLFMLFLAPEDALSPVELVAFALTFRLLYVLASPARLWCAQWIPGFATAIWDRRRLAGDVRTALRTGKPFSARTDLAAWPRASEVRAAAVLGWFMVAFLACIAATVAPSVLVTVLAHAIENIPRIDFDDVYVRVLLACVGIVVALQLVQSLVSAPVVDEARRRGIYSSPTWSNFRARIDLLNEVKWALLVAAIAFTPAAVSSAWLPFVAMTAVVCAILVPRVRGWLRTADQNRDRADRVLPPA